MTPSPEQPEHEEARKLAECLRARLTDAQWEAASALLALLSKAEQRVKQLDEATALLSERRTAAETALSKAEQTATQLTKRALGAERLLHEAEQERDIAIEQRDNHLWRLTKERADHEAELRALQEGNK